MGKSTSINIRSLVIYHREKGKSLGEIARILNLSRSTIQSICNRYYKEDRIENKASTKAPRKITASDVKFLLREINKNPRLPSTELTKMLEEFSGTKVHPITVRRVLKKQGLFSCIARRKPLVSETNRIKRLKFALHHKEKTAQYWNNVLFIDESKFSLFRSDRKQQKVWRKRNEAYKLKNMSCSVKHGGDSVTVWGAMSYNGVGNLEFVEGNMNKEMYLNILKKNLKQSASKLGIENTFHFYQDNDPKHKSYIVRLWLLYNCPKVIETPPQSPDLNPIEHLWEHLERQIRANHKIKSKKDLREVLIQEWNNIPASITQKLVNSIPKRLQSVIKAKGNPTKY